MVTGRQRVEQGMAKRGPAMVQRVEQRMAGAVPPPPTVSSTVEVSPHMCQIGTATSHGGDE